MHAFDQDGDDLPAVVRDFHRAKRRWMDIAWSPAFSHDTLTSSRAFWDYANALDALREAVASHGGRWDVGRLRYVDAGRGGIGIEQVPSFVPAEATEVAITP